MLEGPKTVVDPTMLTSPISAVPTALTLMGLGNFLTFVLSSTKIFIIALISFLLLFVTGLCCTSCSLSGSSLIEVAPTFRFEVGSSFATIPNPVSKAAIFFTRFNHVETNDLDPSDLWGVRSLYVDFHGFRVPEECITHLEAVYSNCGDFMQGFLLGRSTREHFLKLLGSLMNNIEHNFIDTISAERILQWRVAVQELIRIGFVVEFLLDHL